MKKIKIKFKDAVKMFNELSKIKPKRFTTVKNLLKPGILDILNKK